MSKHKLAALLALGAAGAVGMFHLGFAVGVWAHREYVDRVERNRA